MKTHPPGIASGRADEQDSQVIVIGNSQPVAARLAARRPGYSLVEMLVAVTIVALVMSAVAVALQALYKVDRGVRDRGVAERTVWRLSQQIRADAHAARQAVLVGSEDDATGLRLTMGTADEAIEYQFTAGRVVRTRRQGDELAQEVFALGREDSVRWRRITSPAPMAEVEIERSLGKIDSEDSRRVDRVLAAIGIRVAQPLPGATDVDNN